MKMNLAMRMVGVFLGAAIPPLLVGNMMGLEALQTGLIAGGVALLTVLYRLSQAVQDGKLTKSEIDGAFKE